MARLNAFIHLTIFVLFHLLTTASARSSEHGSLRRLVHTDNLCNGLTINKPLLDHLITNPNTPLTAAALASCSQVFQKALNSTASNPLQASPLKSLTRRNNPTAQTSKYFCIDLTTNPACRINKVDVQMVALYLLSEGEFCLLSWGGSFRSFDGYRTASVGWVADWDERLYPEAPGFGLCSYNAANYALRLAEELCYPGAEEMGRSFWWFNFPSPQSTMSARLMVNPRNGNC